MSVDGKYVVFDLGLGRIPIDESGIYLHDRDSGNSTRLSPDGLGRNPSISANGNKIAFVTGKLNLAGPGPDTNDRLDVFVLNRISGSIQRASVDNMNNAHTGGTLCCGSEGDWGPKLNADGRYVVFDSPFQLTSAFLGDITNIYRRDLNSNRTEIVSIGYRPGSRRANDSSRQANIDYNGHNVVFKSQADNLVPGDNNGEGDIFLHDMRAGETELISTGYVAP